jgi:regulatory protein
VEADAAQPDPEAELQVALERSFRYLGHRDRTVAEVRAHLERRGAGEAVIDAAVEDLVRMGYLDDARFAQRFAEDRRQLDAWGSERIERRLLELGVEREHIAAALAGQAAHDELGTAVELLRRRFARPPAEERDRERALGLLARRGYDLELAYDAVRAYERDG